MEVQQATSISESFRSPVSHSYSVFSHRPQSLPDLIRHFESSEARENEDAVIELRRLRMVESGNVQVPNLGEFTLTDWSKRQLANLVGIRWDKWFERATSVEQAEEINRRFERYDQPVKVRTNQEPEVNHTADGFLTALVSPTYTALKNSFVARVLYTALQPIESEFRIIRHDETSRSVSFVVGVGRPYQIGGPGEVGDVWGGIMFRNSGVGFASLHLALHLTRLICRNGMTAPLANAELMRKRHTSGISDDRIFEQLAEKLLDLPGQLRHCGEVLRHSTNVLVDDPREQLMKILQGNALPRKWVAEIMLAYQQEPKATAFGVSSALTRAAQKFAPEERLLLEGAASRYLMSSMA